MVDTLTTDEIVALLDAEPDAVEGLARALMTTLQPLTGNRAAVDVTLEPTGADPVTIPPNSYLAVLIGDEVDDGHLFKCVAGATVEVGGTVVPLVSHLGGARSNLPAGTTLRWTTPIPGLASTVELTEPATGGDIGQLLQLVLYEDLQAAQSQADFLAAGLGEFPGAMLVWDSGEPSEGRTGGPDRGSTRAGLGRAVYRETFWLFVVASTVQSDPVRRREGWRLLQRCARLLTDREDNDDGECLSVRGTTEVLGRDRYARTKSSYIYRLQVRCSTGLDKFETRIFEPWARTRGQTTQGPDDVDQLDVPNGQTLERMLGSDVPIQFVGIYSGNATGPYQVDVGLVHAAVGEACALTNYPTLGAGGYLVLRAVSADGLTLTCDEVLTYGTDVAVDGGRVTLTRARNSTDISYSWTKEGTTTSGTLTGYAAGVEVPEVYQRLWRGSVRGRVVWVALGPADNGELCGLFAYPAQACAGTLGALTVAGRKDISATEAVSLGALPAGTLRLRWVNHQLIATWDGAGTGRLVRYTAD